MVMADAMAVCEGGLTALLGRRRRKLPCACMSSSLPAAAVARGTGISAAAPAGLMSAASSSSINLPRPRRRLRCPRPSSSPTLARPPLNQTPRANLEASFSLDGQEPLPKPESVHVKFMLQKECAFGQQFLLVGDVPQLGKWDPTKAIPLQWSEPHVWTVDMELPLGEKVHFKLILESSSGESIWQPGPDRVLQTWETANMILVLVDWENAEKQKIGEHQLVGSTEDLLPAWSLDAGQNEQIGGKLVSGLQPDSDMSIEETLGSAVEVEGPATASLLSGVENNTFKKENAQELQDKNVEKNSPSSAVIRTPEANHSLAAGEAMINLKEGRNDLQCSRDTLSKLYLLAIGFLVRELT